MRGDGFLFLAVVFAAGVGGVKVERPQRSEDDRP
jgi:hypothetical protein